MIRRSFLLVASSALMLSACGFQLRGEQNYAFKRLAIVGAPPPVAARLTRMIEGGSDSVVVDSTANADAVLRVGESRGFSTLTLSSLGAVEEYQVNYSLNYALMAPDGSPLIRPSTIALNRAMTYSDQYSTAKVTESDLLFADMQNDAVDQLTRRLAVLKTLHPTADQVVPGVAPRAPLPPPPL
ncbi:LPS assembly lipoprotein LptE [Paraburkholderia tropica]|uniref:LPS-assembly lipoprotein LptE n=1 Tax=Paraburkholderia tropica TaxID=92647 RepID=A0A1A5X1R3_9BURK|nr:MULTISPECIES: LPS assembly lipoprotein LptE [Paraburkholderia]MBB2977206.1 LPS-assembly lipoprotein [Paraburkholderia tropica]OBR47392.1 lipopolysaccharide-assembly family protein [Paraburkholderia tropica]RQM46190.1 lipopolysaccharide-assembly family protein [Paraburkholderia bannensis]RQN39026.1 lipopolysaccharide-assembly family protein [Paraburkholderia tropica]SEJ04600.1 LPS-assembly lipoprotein [Paraburkholderia tropica]